MARVIRQGLRGKGDLARRGGLTPQRGPAAWPLSLAPQPGNPTSGARARTRDGRGQNQAGAVYVSVMKACPGAGEPAAWQRLARGRGVAQDAERADLEAVLGTLLRYGRTAIASARPSDGADAMRQAARMARGLVAGAPGEQRYQRMLGGALYGLAATLNDAGDYAGAAGALTEARGAYARVRAPDIPFLVADVRMRRAVSLAASGAGISAAADAQAAVMTYWDSADPHRVNDAYLGLARTLMLACDIFGAFADPHIGLAAARQGLAWITRALAGHRAALDQPTRLAMTQAASVEIALLDLLGRGGQGQGDGQTAAAVLECLEAAPVATLSAARLGSTAGHPALETVEAAVFVLERVSGRDDGLRDLLLRPGHDQAFAPVLLPAPGQAPAAGHQAALAAEDALRYGDRAGVPLGLIAHYLLAACFAGTLAPAAAGTPPGPGAPGEALAAWSRLLAALAARLGADGETALARDAAGWGSRVAAAASHRGQPATRASQPPGRASYQG
jgi:hypothetical protein